MNVQMLAGYALDVSPDTKYQAFSAEAWAKAAEVTLLGLGLIFAVLAVLWLVLLVFKLIFARDGKKKNAPKPEITAAPAETAAPETPVTDDGELVAVITAAIAAYRASEEGCEGENINGFRVVSFKRAANGRAWNSNK